jgi:hypothetical protein
MGTLDDALAGVAAGRRSPTPPRRRVRSRSGDRGRRRSRSRSRDRKKKSKDKREKKEKKKEKKKRGRSPRPRSRSPPPPPPPTEPACDPAAARAAASTFLAAFPGEATALRGLLAAFDGGTALDVAGVPDPGARATLAALLLAAGASKPAADTYARRPGAPAALEVVGDLVAADDAPPPSAGPSPAPPPAPVVMGPAAPPPELLAAAAAAAVPADSDDDGAVGPAPPPGSDDSDGPGDDAKRAEVARVAAVVAAAADGRAPDAYAVLGVAPDTSPAAIRRAHRRLALATHPDKNPAPAAAAAFEAAAAAARTLADAGARAALDASRAAAADAADFAAFAEGEARKRAWRVARGEGAGESPPPPHGPAARDAWMTELPPDRRPGAPAQQVNVTSFSQRAPAAPQDSGWLDTPAARAARLAAPTGPATIGPAPPPPPSAVQAAVDAYTREHRAASLMEQHAAQRAKDEKKAAAPGAPSATADPSGHPWKPWNRDEAMALGAQRKAGKADPAKEAAALKARFGGSGPSREFL